MSEWGRVVFYYDYEVDTMYYGRERIKGLVSKAYKYPGMVGLLFHGESGFKYFLERYDVEYSKMDCREKLLNGGYFTGWEGINVAFDVMWEGKKILLGSDDVAETVEEIIEAISQGKKLDDEKIAYDLYACEGTDGELVIYFTGNPDDGYKAKYGFYCGYATVEERYMDAQTAVRIYMEHGGYSEEEIQEVLESEHITMYGDEIALFDSVDEYQDVLDLGVELIKEIQDELINNKSEE